MTRCGVPVEGWRGVRVGRWTSPTRFPGCGQTSRPQSRTHRPRLAGLVFETVKGAVCPRGAPGGGPSGPVGKSLRPPGPSGVGRPGFAASLLPAVHLTRMPDILPPPGEALQSGHGRLRGSPNHSLDLRFRAQLYPASAPGLNDLGDAPGLSELRISLFSCKNWAD